MMQTLQTKQTALLTFLLSTLLMISCGGQKNQDSITSINPNGAESELTVDSLNGNIQMTNNLGQNQSGNAIIEPEVRYNNNNEIKVDTFVFNGLKRIVYAQETKIIFPNGKALSNQKDATIYKDIPKQAQVFYYSHEDEEYFKEVDLKKISNAQMVKWLGKMKLHPSIKLSDLDYMIVSSDILDLEETPGRVCLAAYAEVWTEKGTLAGHIAHIDIYDYEGKLILQIPMYEYGGGSFTITKDQKYLLSSVNGSSLGDGDFTCGLISPQIRIYTFQDGKYQTKLNMSCAGWGFSGLENNFWFATNTYKGGIYPEETIVKLIKFSDDIRFKFDKFTEDGVVTQDGKLWKYDIYTFEEWNKRYEPNFDVKKD